MFFLWVVLREDFSAITLVSGVLVSAACVVYAKRYIPLRPKMLEKIRLANLLFYPFRLVWEVYAAGFYMIKLIITRGAKAEIVDINLKLRNETLKILLAESITLTPGTIFLELEGHRMSVLWFRPKTTHQLSTEEMEQSIKGVLEDKLLKAEIR